eukprot:scaffold89268_cov40-Attheya_sp.AAC.1
MPDRLRQNEQFPTLFVCATSHQETPEGFILKIKVTLPSRNCNVQNRRKPQDRSPRAPRAPRVPSSIPNRNQQDDWHDVIQQVLTRQQFSVWQRSDRNFHHWHGREPHPNHAVTTSSLRNQNSNPEWNQLNRVGMMVVVVVAVSWSSMTTRCSSSTTCCPNWTSSLCILRQLL